MLSDGKYGQLRLMRVKEAATKVNMRTVKEAGEKPFSSASGPDSVRASLRSAIHSGPSAPRACSFAAHT